MAAQGFKNPRKKLGNNLPKDLLERANIDQNRRAETLTIDEWQALASVV
jgi:16S rRNA A1518/A1519 N6-dimethyltransferase RsmA/KsgA/DIM1 with predicted DNA glycosylase/AP lyase activity